MGTVNESYDSLQILVPKDASSDASITFIVKDRQMNQAAYAVFQNRNPSRLNLTIHTNRSFSQEHVHWRDLLDQQQHPLVVVNDLRCCYDPSIFFPVLLSLRSCVYLITNI
jgi:hypothetical protein